MDTTAHDLDAFFDAYVTAALWSSTDDSGTPLDAAYDVEDIAEEALAELRVDCIDFVEANAEDLATIDAAQAGNDFWLTRNRHGAGFWDRGLLGELGDRLTSAAHVYGSVDLYAGADGKLYAQ